MYKDKLMFKQLGLVPYHLAKTYYQDKAILDVACGNGLFTNLLKDFSPKEIVGVDLNVELIADAKNKYNGIDFIVGNVEQLDKLFVSKKFDVIIANQIIEYIVDLESFFKSLENILNKDGLIIVTCPNGDILGDGVYYNEHHNKFSYVSFNEELLKYFDIPFKICLTYPVSGTITFNDIKHQTEILAPLNHIQPESAMLFTAIISNTLKTNVMVDLNIHSSDTWSELIGYDYVNDIKNKRKIFELEQRSLIADALKIELDIAKDKIWRLEKDIESRIEPQQPVPFLKRLALKLVKQFKKI